MVLSHSPRRIIILGLTSTTTLRGRTYVALVAAVDSELRILCAMGLKLGGHHARAGECELGTRIDASNLRAQASGIL